MTLKSDSACEAGVKVVWQLAGEAGRVGRSVEPSSDAGCFEIS